MRKTNFYILGLIVIAIGSFLGLIFVLITTNPQSGGLASLSAFYALSFVLAFAAASLAGYQVRRKFGARELVAQHLKISLRQGILLAILVLVSLILQSFRLLTVLNTILLAGAIIFLESFFITTQKNRNN